ncbi:hypothetical protein IAG41_21880 [Sphingomonas sp. JC676]|uniref:hypothetical protein n=1 Tax=Sphingomonas sp. JC676 TaxID=2768065 RepID=UPI001657D4C0|nr:hypothetical protein [Sphingomonas sp. JC676]MBC9035047.1 hypothetical protein [Sphingomonas sp. JC676]
MRRFASLLVIAALGGCSFPHTIQRISVDYNSAVSGMANELTLLNIVRAKEGMPLHYTSISQLSGSLSVKASGSLNGQFRGSGVTDTNKTTTATATTTEVTKQVAEGVDFFSPTVGGEVSSGPTFQVGIFDTQKFYQGVLSAVPASTVENYLDQGFDSQLVMRLLIERVEFVLKETKTGVPFKVGDVVGTIRNRPWGADAAGFAGNIACYSLDGATTKPDGKRVMALSRLTLGADGKAIPVAPATLALLDGQKFDVSAPVGSDSHGDDQLFIVRPASEKSAVRLVPKAKCDTVEPIKAKPPAPSVMSPKPGALPDGPPPSPIYKPGELAIPGRLPGKNYDQEIWVNVDAQVYFRSPESVIRFLGQYLEGSEKYPTDTYKLGTHPLFAVTQGRSFKSVVSTKLLGKHYYIADDDDRADYMRIIAIAQQLINLQKESSDKPFTTPVQVIQ